MSTLRDPAIDLGFIASRDLAADYAALQADSFGFAAQLIRDHHERLSDAESVAVVEVPCRVLVLDDYRSTKGATL